MLKSREQGTFLLRYIVTGPINSPNNLSSAKLRQSVQRQVIANGVCLKKEMYCVSFSSLLGYRLNNTVSSEQPMLCLMCECCP